MNVSGPTPDEKALKRVLAIARADGWSLVIVAVLGGLVSLVQGGWFGAMAGLLVVVAGAGELHGRRRLLQGAPSGVDWLVGAQLFLLTLTWIYAWCRWKYFDAAVLWAELPELARMEIDRQLIVAGADPELDRPLLLEMMNLMVCALLAFLTLLYQGGLAIYYARQRGRVRQALLASPPPLA